MILEWMATATATGALVTAAAHCAERGAVQTHRARRWVWLLGIVATIVVAFMSPRIAFSRAAAAPAVAPVAQTDVAAVAALAPAVSKADLMVAGLWASASVIFIALLIVAHVRLVRSARSLQPAQVAGHEVRVSRDFGPATVGLLRHRILVPSWVLALTDDEQRLVVTHEVEHIRAGDPLVALAGVLGAALMPWNAALWWQLARLRLAIEVDCDARVVGRTERAALAYGTLLLRVRDQVQSTRRPALALAHAKSSLGKRLDALLARRRERAPRWLAAGVAVAAGAGVLSSVAFVPGPRGRELLDELRASRVASRVAPSAVVAAPVTTPRPDTPVTPVTPDTALAAAATRVSTLTQMMRNMQQARATPRKTTRQPDLSVPPVAAATYTFAAPSIDREAVVRDLQRAPAAGYAGTVTRLGGRGGRGGFATMRPAPDSMARATQSSAAATVPDSMRPVLRAVGGRVTATPAVIRARPDSTRPQP